VLRGGIETEKDVEVHILESDEKEENRKKALPGDFFMRSVINEGSEGRVEG
jgi:hypothetical protein